VDEVFRSVNSDRLPARRQWLRSREVLRQPENVATDLIQTIVFHQLRHSQLTLIPTWLADYHREWLRPDVIAGLTTAAVVIPKAMAYATIAGLPVQVGLYTALIPTLIYAILGSSRPLSVTTTTTIAILTGAELEQIAPNDDLNALIAIGATLTLVVGVSLLAASLLRLGFVANFISEPVLVGFKAGIGVVIIVDQLPKLFGIHFARASFFHNALWTARELPNASLPTLLVGVATIVLLIALERYLPGIPAPLIAIAAGICAVWLLNLHARGVDLVGQVPPGLPPITIPRLGILKDVWPGALGIALMSFTETVAAGRAFATVDEPTPQANRELLATGLANIGGAFFSAMPAGGGTSQTAVNRVAGARSQLAELVTGTVALATMLLLAPVIANMPQATLAAVVVVYSIGLIRPAEFCAILEIRRTEFIWALSALVGVVSFGTLRGILVAIVVSLVALGYQVANPPVYVLGRKRGTNVFRPRSDQHQDDELFPGLLLLRMEGRIFFANAGHIAQKIRPLVEQAAPRVVAIDLSAVPDLEYTALKMLMEAEQRQRDRGISLWLVGLNPDVFTIVQRSALGRALGREAMHFNLEQAVARYSTMYVH
jgi:sulfate permease, SulP family